MKKIIMMLLILSLGITFVGCNSNDSNKGTVERQVKNFDKDGTLIIKIMDEENKEIENINVTYEGEFLSKVEYVIYEKDIDTLEIDRNELSKKDPDELTTSDELVLHAVFTTSPLEEKFEGLQKTNISKYVDTLKETYPEYNFKIQYEK